MVQFSFWVFVTHLSCIIYLMNSGEEFIIQFAKSAGLTHTLLKVQFFIMSMCYIGLAYSCVSQNDFYEHLLAIMKGHLSPFDYFLSVTLYILIHVLWCSHFIDLSIRAHVYKHSIRGHYDTALLRFIKKTYRLIFSSNTQKSKHHK